VLLRFTKFLPKAGSLKRNTALEYSKRVVQEGGRRCKKSTLNDLVHLTPLRIPLMNPPQYSTITTESTALGGTNLAALATAAAPDTQDPQDASETARRQTEANSEMICALRSRDHSQRRRQRTRSGPSQLSGSLWRKQQLRRREGGGGGWDPGGNQASGELADTRVSVAINRRSKPEFSTRLSEVS
jgi:hypothetical protein